MDWVLSFSVIFCNYLIGKKYKNGWLLNAVIAVAWVIYAIVVLNPPQYGLVVASVFNFLISLRNYYLWWLEEFDSKMNWYKSQLQEIQDDLEEYLNQYKEVKK
jgi:hypothetical protein